MAKKNKVTQSAQPTKNRAARRRKSKYNVRQILLVGALMLAMLAFILTSIPNFNSKPKVNRPTNPTTSAPGTPAGQSSTAFVKQGALSFLVEDGAKKIDIDIEVAQDDRKRAQGLMFRRHMEPNQGMLFLMESMREQSFYMRNTHIPLDILYVDDQLKIVSIAKSTVPLSESPIPSNGDALYVVEVIAGFTDMHGIKAGDKIAFELN